MKKLIAVILMASMFVAPAMAITPAFYLDKISFETVDKTTPEFVDNLPAAGNKTSIKGLNYWVENRDWGYLRMSWKAKSKAQGYQIEVCGDKNFGHVERGKTWRNTATKQLGAFEKGVKYIRVRALYKNDRVGKWSKITKIART